MFPNPSRHPEPYPKTGLARHVQICTLVEYGFATWFSVWNSLDLLTYGLQIAIAIMYFGRLRLDSLALSILLASQILLLFWKVRGSCVRNSTSKL